MHLFQGFRLSVVLRDQAKPQRSARVAPYPGGGYVPTVGYRNAPREFRASIRFAIMITQRQQEEEKFRSDEEKFRTVIESAPNGLLMVNSAGRIVLCNSEMERMFGYSTGELIGQPMETLVPSRLRGEHPVLRQQYQEDPSKRQMGAGRDLAGVRKDGVLKARFNIPGIAFSGYGADEDIAASSEAGFTEHLTKPVEWASLRQAINRVLAAA